jgi:hypothetical protein
MLHTAGVHKSWAPGGLTKFCTVVPIFVASQYGTCFSVTLMAPRILMWLVDIWKIFTHVTYRVSEKQVVTLETCNRVICSQNMREVARTNSVERQGSLASVCSVKFRRVWRYCSENRNGCLEQVNVQQRACWRPPSRHSVYEWHDSFFETGYSVKHVWKSGRLIV